MKPIVILKDPKVDLAWTYKRSDWNIIHYGNWDGVIKAGIFINSMPLSELQPHLDNTHKLVKQGNVVFCCTVDTKEMSFE